MIVRNTFFYFLAGGLPGIVNFFALAFYTRVLSIDEFGRYSLILAGAGLVQVIMFLWLLFVLGRFLPANKNTPELVLQPLLAIFIVLTGIIVVMGTAVALFWPQPSWRVLIALGIILIIAQAWHEFNLRIATAQIVPLRYGLLSGTKALLALGLGGSLAFLGWGAKAPIVGVAVGSFIAWWLFGRREWTGLKPIWPSEVTLRAYSSYGLPLTITFGLVWITSTSDRLIIGWLLGEADTGNYVVGYDLAQYSLGLLLSIVNTAALPLVIKKFEFEGALAATEQLRQNGQLMFILAFSGAAGLIAIGPAMIELWVGEAFREGALLVFPWIAVMAAVAGVKAFHFDLAFHISKHSKWLILTSGLAAFSNVILNIFLVPRFGIVGAAWAGLAAFLVAAILSAILGKKAFPMPPVAPLIIRGIAVATFTYIAARWVMNWQLQTLPRLIIGVILGGAATLVSAVFLIFFKISYLKKIYSLSKNVL